MEAAVAQILIIGAVFIVRGTAPNDDFYVIGRDVASAYIAVVDSLPVKGANGLAIHLDLTP
jgi:hypothetical protein